MSEVYKANPIILLEKMFHTNHKIIKGKNLYSIKERINFNCEMKTPRTKLRGIMV
jgi:hypothetical protein